MTNRHALTQTMPRGIAWIACVAALVSCLPLALAPLPALYDYPAHLERMVITADLLSRHRYAALYALHPAIVPNLATDFVMVPMLLAGIGVQTAGRLCLALLILGLGTGAMRLARALHGRWSILPVLAFGLVFGEPMQFGFMNYIAGIAVLLHALAFWLRLRGGALPRQIAANALFAALLFFCHLIPCALFLACTLSICALDGVRRYNTGAGIGPPLRDAAALCPAGLLAIALYLSAPLAAAGAHDSLVHDIIAHFPSKRERLSLLLHASDAYWPWVNRAETFCVLGALAWLAWGRRVRVHAALAPLILALAVAVFIFPAGWAGTFYIADRLPYLMAFLVLASIEATPPGARGRAILTALVLGFVALRGLGASIAWNAADRAYAPLIDALSRLPDGTRLYTATLYRQSTKLELPRPFSHLAATATFRHVIFDGDAFADPSQNIVVRLPDAQRLASLAPKPWRVDIPDGLTPRTAPFTPALLAQYDDVVVVHGDYDPDPLPPALVLVARSGPAALYRIRH